MKSDFYIILTFLCTTARISTGLKCFTCNRASSNRECNEQGAVECERASQTGCISQFKYTTEKIEVTKFCASSMFCNHLAQMDCANRKSSSAGVCYQCCTTDACNYHRADMQPVEYTEPPLPALTYVCPVPDFSVTQSKVIKTTSEVVVMMVDLARVSLTGEWSFIQLFSRPLPDTSIIPFGTTLSHVSPDKRVVIYAKDPLQQKQTPNGGNFIISFISTSQLDLTDIYYTDKIGLIQTNSIPHQCQDAYVNYYYTDNPKVEMPRTTTTQPSTQPTTTTTTGSTAFRSTPAIQTTKSSTTFSTTVTNLASITASPTTTTPKISPTAQKSTTSSIPSTSKAISTSSLTYSMPSTSRSSSSSTTTVTASSTESITQLTSSNSTLRPSANVTSTTTKSVLSTSTPPITTTENAPNKSTTKLTTSTESVPSATNTVTQNTSLTTPVVPTTTLVPPLTSTDNVPSTTTKDPPTKSTAPTTTSTTENTSSTTTSTTTATDPTKSTPTATESVSITLTTTNPVAATTASSTATSTKYVAPATTTVLSSSKPPPTTTDSVTSNTITGISNTTTALSKTTKTTPNPIPSTSSITTTKSMAKSNPFQFVINSNQKCTELNFELINPMYTGRDDKWRFSYRIEGDLRPLKDWKIFIDFNEDISVAMVFKLKLVSKERLWTFEPLSSTTGSAYFFNAVGVATRNMKIDSEDPDLEHKLPKGIAFACGNLVSGYQYIKPLEATERPTKSTAMWKLTTTTTTSAPVVTTPYVYNTSTRCNGPSGVLPKFSSNIDPTKFKPSPIEDGLKYDYNEVLHLSLLFYETQRSGVLPEDNRVPWRGYSGLKDGCDVGVDLVGGYFDAGDHVKFGFPMAATVTVIAWGMIEFKDAYVDAEEWENALKMIKWGTDYFIKAHTSLFELWVQVGKGQVDHDYWGHAETMDMKRPAFKIDKDHPGSEVAAETAAALAAASIIFKDIDIEYSKTLIKHSSELFHFATKYRGNYQNSVPDVEQFYKSWSGYEDELAWAAAWLGKATGLRQYTRFAQQYAYMVNEGEFSWDQKGPGVLALLSQLDPTKYLDKLRAGIRQTMGRNKTPGGLSWFMAWGPNRYSANYAFICLVTANILGDTDEAEKYRDYAKSQIHAMLGDGDNERSYVVGYGVNPPQRPHHRSSSCEHWTDPLNAPCSMVDLNKDTDNKLVLYGALVGGPSDRGHYLDDRKDYKLNEVAMDYNAGFQSAVAGLKHFVMKRRRT